MLRTRLTHVDALRGVASLGVAWFHFTNGNPAFLSGGWLKLSGKGGWLGVEMFFVISGFIIPYTLAKAGYSIALFPRFLAKRVIRLDPPYLATILLIIVLGFVSAAVPGFRGAPFSVGWRQVILHLGYLNAFFGEEWLNPVFWTLAIEFQYYLLIGMLFPVLTSRFPMVRVTAIFWLCVLAHLFASGRLVIHYMPLFLLGVCVYYLRTDTMNRRLVFLLFALLIVVAGVELGLAVASVASATAVLLVFDRIPYPRFLVKAGAISYSLYLLHVPIGGRVINLSLRLPDTFPVKCAAVTSALGMSLLAAYLLYVAVERPAQGISSRIRLKPAPAEESSAAPSLV